MALALIAGSAQPAAAGAETIETIALRGHQQTLRLYGARGGTPVVVTSGDATLRPEDEPDDFFAIAEFAARGYLACRGGLALPRILADVSALIAGGYRCTFVK